MTSVTTKIEGLEELAKKSNLLKRSFGTTTLRTALRNAAKPVLQRAKEKVPVDTGGLKRSLASRATVRKSGFGVGDVFARRGGGYEGYHANLIELGTSTQRAQPFLRPAIQEAARDNSVRNAFIASLNKTIAKVLG